ncbi:MAG: ComEC/Rec2 family competence protein [Acidimicrobiia bacterium]
MSEVVAGGRHGGRSAPGSSPTAGDLAVGVVAVAAWVGALAARSVPVVLLAVAATGAVAAVRGQGWRRVLLAAAAVGVLTSGLAARSLDGLRPPPEGPVAGVAVLLTDPEPRPGGGVRADVRLDGRRLLAEARSPAAAAALAPRLAGEGVVVRGAVSGFERAMPWAQARHLAGRLRIEMVTADVPAAPHAALANRLRRTLERGTASLPERHRSLLAGITLGDDRAQPAELTADFRASGLTHLLAVSGSNVLFVLVAVGPLLRRLRLWPRFFLAVGVVAGFALLTRFEPSVVRAAAMAAVALWATTTGRRSGGVRHLGLAMIGLLLVDPLLSRSVGFRLSVAACLGVLVLAPRLVERLPGPRWAREALATTIGAQLAVAPVLVPVFGAMPLAALPANVAAAPLAAGLMVWGITAGLVAGVVGGAVGAVLHLPSALALAALERVAAWSAALPLGHVDLRHVAVLAVAGLLLTRPPPWRAVGALAVAVAVLLAGASPVPPGSEQVGWAATVWTDGPVAVVDLDVGASATEVLDVLRRRRVHAVTVVVVRSARDQPSEVVRALRARFPVHAVLAPPGSPVPDHVVPRPGLVVRVGGFQVRVDEAEPVLRARIGWGAGARDGQG